LDRLLWSLALREVDHVLQRASSTVPSPFGRAGDPGGVGGEVAGLRVLRMPATVPDEGWCSQSTFTSVPTGPLDE
jgi:hypothetical protein